MYITGKLEMEAALEADEGGEYRAGILGKLNALRDSCAAARRELHDPDTFRRLEALAAAVDSAVALVDGSSRQGAASRAGRWNAA